MIVVVVVIVVVAIGVVVVVVVVRVPKCVGCDDDGGAHDGDVRCRMALESSVLRSASSYVTAERTMYVFTWESRGQVRVVSEWSVTVGGAERHDVM